jgi:transposase
LLRDLISYSLDLRRKVVEAVLRGMPKAEAARSFGIGISTVKRYVGKAHKGEDLAPRRPPGKSRKLDEGAMRLLEGDLKERPALTLSHRRSFLERVLGAQVSESTTSRAIKRLGWSREKFGGCRRTRRVPEGRLEGYVRRKDASESL